MRNENLAYRFRCCFSWIFINLSRFVGDEFNADGFGFLARPEINKLGC